MSEHTHTYKSKPADHPSFQLPASLAALAVPLGIAGAVMLLLGVLIGLFAGPGEGIGPKRYTMSAYLTAFMYCFSISLGCLFFVLIQHLCRAGWSVVVRRVAEMLMIAIPALGILFIPVVITAWSDKGTLYPWSYEGYAASHGVPAEIWTEKVMYLSSDWFTIRALVYLVCLSAIAVYYFKLSSRQDETGEVTLTERMQARSGPSVIAFSVITTFAAFDWLMSLSPMWFSTMFGVYIFAGSVLAAHAAIVVVTYLLQSKGAIRDEVTIEHYHDLGKLLFGFVTFWTYISFSQFMLIWYGNIPEETHWYYTRMQGPWEAVSYGLIFFHWLFPFLGLLSRHVRRRPTMVFGWAIYLLIMHFIDLYWIVMPEATTTFGGAVGVAASLLLTLGMLGLYAGGILWFIRANQVRVIPVRDPRLPESLAFENL
jgi:hypothetical protein